MSVASCIRFNGVLYTTALQSCITMSVVSCIRFNGVLYITALLGCPYDGIMLRYYNDIDVTD